MRRRWSGIGGVGALLLGAFLLGLFHTRSADRPTPAPVAETAAPPSISRIADEVRNELATGYYRDLGPNVLGRKTVDDMLRALRDPYTEYLTPDRYRELQNTTSGRYSGVGLTVGPAKGGLLVTSALRGPAREAGIRRGDVIVSIDGRPAGQMAFARSLSLIQGAEGTKVHLTIRRPNIGRIDFTVVRQKLPAPTSRARLLQMANRRIGYVRVYRFAKDSSDDLRARTAGLVERGAQGVVVDLRDNPGGLLVEAVRSASVFLRHGIVCTTDGAHQERQVFHVMAPTPFPRLPVVVLVDHGSASASEILAAGLSENHRAVVVGQRTYGKAAVQSLLQLSNGAALKLTTATYLTPAGHSLLGRGIRPRVRAVDNPKTPADEGLLAAERALVKQIR